MQDTLKVPPVLSTPATHIFENPRPATLAVSRRQSDEDILITYEVQRTIAEIRQGRWRRIALQFPDGMLVDAPRVYDALKNGLRRASHEIPSPTEDSSHPPIHELQELTLKEPNLDVQLYILADTSYGACCVDEIAAEHVDADVVVHYGRACLSPTARLPVIHIFTTQPLDMNLMLEAFTSLYTDYHQKVILMADVTYSSHLPVFSEALEQHGYINVFSTSILHDPSSPLPNRTVPEDVTKDLSLLKNWQLFHVSDPPQSLLLTLSSRLSTVHIYPTSQSSPAEAPQPLLASTALALRRRYALLTSLSTVSIFGILINTLSVKNYLHIVEHVKAQILAAGKKSYTFVVGKVNAAKVANFSEVGGWVVIGCWESSLVESKDFWRPVITPFELGLALKRDEERLWTGEWHSDFQELLDEPSGKSGGSHNRDSAKDTSTADFHNSNGGSDDDSELESSPPEFDLRTGRYISHSRPMRAKENSKSHNTSMLTQPIGSLVKRPKGDLVIIGDAVSPGAEYLRSHRTWKGLGSDLEIAYDESGTEQGTAIEEGRSGIARGYTTGDTVARR